MIKARYKKLNSSLSAYTLPLQPSKVLQRMYSSSRIKLPTLPDDFLNQKNKKNVKEWDDDMEEVVDVLKQSCNGVQRKELDLPQLPTMPKIRDTSFREIFLQKVNLCSEMCNFGNQQCDSAAKITKANTIVEISDTFCVFGFCSVLDHEMHDAIMNMIKINLIRPQKEIDPKDIIYMPKSLLKTPDWPHIQLIYKLLFNYYKICYSFQVLSENFIRDLLPLIYVSDPLERDYVSVIFSEYIYHNPDNGTISLNDLSRMLMNNRGDPNPCMTYTVLTIIQNLANINTNLCIEIKSIYESEVIGLINDPLLRVFSYPFTELTKTYLQCDERISQKIILALSNHWPISNPMKEEIMLDILLIALQYYNDNNNYLLMRAIVIISKCCCNESFKIAEKANKAVQSSYFLSIISADYRKYIEILYPNIKRAFRHWSSEVRTEAYAAERSLTHIDSRFSKGKVPSIKIDDQANLWIAITKSAAKRDQFFGSSGKLKEIIYTFHCNSNVEQCDTPGVMAKRLLTNDKIIRPLVPNHTCKPVC